mmetsp:Transcript_46520/g.74888  ORF Transcript_46520/g.74888 Transcript_46520/m.74888 type:complete len:119 (+) Transcript_46520:35-391(+)
MTDQNMTAQATDLLLQRHMMIITPISWYRSALGETPDLLPNPNLLRNPNLLPRRCQQVPSLLALLALLAVSFYSMSVSLSARFVCLSLCSMSVSLCSMCVSLSVYVSLSAPSVFVSLL